MRAGFGCLLWLCWVCGPLTLLAADVDRWEWSETAYDPYYVGRDFPKLITPQWVGEAGVEAVVVLAIDDMRDTAKYEAYLRPILTRLQQIDGRAPVSIMTCSVDLRDEQLQAWLHQGLSIEVHTIDHPCPLLRDGDFHKAKSTYDRCVDLLHQIPGNQPVAFRMPCCDSLNTPSPRFWAEIFNKKTAQGNYLQIDTSVFNIITSHDTSLPRELVLDADGQERFRKYLPFPSFVNTIEDYPYPYLIGGVCWEFPCVVPSDWEAQHVQQPNNPRTVEDLKAALDAIVIKQGTFNLVFHPHGWIRNDQIVELIDHAVTKHGSKVKFLNFREALDRINTHLLKGQPLRAADGSDQHVRLRDLNQDGLLEVVRLEPSARAALAPDPQFPAGVQRWDAQGRDAGLRLVDVNEDGFDDLIFSNGERYSLHLWNAAEQAWNIQAIAGQRGVAGGLGPVIPMIVRPDGTNNGAWFHSRQMWVQNEDTNRLPDLVERLSFADMLSDYRRRQDEKGDLPSAKSPEAALETMRLRPGLRIELVAAEPLVMDPVAFDWGADGSLWVAEMGDYPNGATWNKPGDPLGEPGGRIKLLTDVDGDGRYDRATVFLDKVPFPTGVKAWRGGVLVSAAPDIIYAEDTDGDGVADRREVLYTGFAPGNQQHRVNGLQWGLDNWLYLANGDSGGKVKSMKTGLEIDIRGRDLRIRPDTGELEAVAGQTQFGRNQDDWGNWFGGNNSNPMWHYVLDAHYLLRNPNFAPPDGRHHLSNQPGAAPVFPISRTLTRFNDFDKADRFTSACSPIIYRDHWLFSAEEFAGADDPTATTTQAFICEPVHNLVHREVVTPHGATFASRRADDEQQSEFLASSDNWFRPTMVRTGPDGALWVCDMYRLVIEHPEWIPATWQEKLVLRAGHDRGRIYRVSANHRALRPFVRLDGLDTSDLVRALDSPNGWQRDMAQQMLLWRDDRSAIAALEQLATTAARPTTRLQAYCTLDGMHALNAEHVLKAVRDDHPGVRRHGVRWAARIVNEAPEVAAALVSLVDDADPTVRMQVAYALGEWRQPESGALLVRLAVRDRDDAYLQAAVMSSVHNGNLATMLEQMWPIADAHPRLVDQLLATVTASGDPKALQAALQRVLQRPTTGYALWQLTSTLSMLRAIDRRGANRDKLWGDELQRHLSQLLDDVRAQAANTDLDEPQRLLAIEVWGAAATSSTDLAALAELLAPRNSTTIQSAAVTAITARNLPEAPQLLLADWSARLPAIRSLVLDRLLARPAWTNELLTAIERDLVPPHQLDARLRQQLLQHRDASIQSRATILLAGSEPHSREKVLDEYRVALQLSGETSRGSEVFAKRCGNCHRLGEVGKSVGPDLTALTDKSPEALLVAIFDPNRAVEDKFRDYVAVTQDGRQWTGMITSESGNSLTLTGADAKEQVILRAELDELRSTGKSLMPEGMEKDLSAQDLADVIQFVRSFTLPPKSFPGNTPQVAPVRDDGSIRCLAIHARVYGPTLVFEEPHRNLGYWGSQEDHAIWSLDVPQAGRYQVHIEYACDDGTAGNRYLLSIAQQTLGGVVEGTGTWDNYRSVPVGEVDLPAGAAELVFRSDGPIRSHLLDLRTIRLSPR